MPAAGAVKKLLLSSLLLTLMVAAAYAFYQSLPDVLPLRRNNPRITALMELRAKEYRAGSEGAPRRQVWVPYAAVSEPLKKAILISEDAAFFSHGGIDLDELQAAMRQVWRTLSFRRGGSTITMQLARNLYLSPAKNPLRKLKEIAIARQLEQALSKERIFEIYLNVVEWGKNIYGAEAAARFYFGKAAANLDSLEAATLAAMLPNPRGAAERSLLARRNRILRRLASVGYLTEEDYRRLRQMPWFSQSRAAAKP
jgi:monofunctional biosynthetic peptidoglycan transglycosylase